MKTVDFIQWVLFVALLIGLTPVLGRFMAKVFQGERTWLHRPFGRLESFIYKASGIDATKEMKWQQYAIALMIFHILGIIAVTALQMLQAWLPLNPRYLPNVPWDLALNTAVSFVTNTNWQAYAGETTMTHFTQMAAFTVQNFLSAACGIAVAIALTRAIARRSSNSIGNFWVDMTRAIIYLLLPISMIFSLVLVGEGVVQTLASSVAVTSLEGVKQTLPLGPVASQVAIKMLGTNGGGFFNANAAHPFENPTGLTNFLQMLSIFMIGAALTYTFGIMTKARKHGWIIFSAMLVMFLSVTALSLASEYTRNPVLQSSGIMEGKEARFGVFSSVLFSSVTTAASCGGVNAMHSSLSPLAGGLTMVNMMLGEVIFGGVGAGLYGMLLFVILTVFIAGLMVGRTPEYLGKKIEAREMTMVIVAVLAPCASILLGTAIASLNPAALSSLSSKGPHGFSELLYAFTSAAANNGSAFAGLNANTAFFNLMLSLAMVIGRFAIIIPVLAIAGSLAQKKYSPASAGTFETDNALFAVMLVGVVVIVGALTFLPALSLGPLVEHLMMLQGRAF